MILTLTSTPPERFDGVAWTAARIEQASSATGSFALVEQIDLSPVDVDPSNPQERGLTTELATAGDWYRIVWVADDASESDPTDPVQFNDEETALGSATELASILSIRTPSTEQTAALNRVLLVATGEVYNEIGRRDLSGWEVALATEVAMERAAEHWAQLKAPFGFVGLGAEAGPSVAARDSWERHAFKLAPLKASWGLA